MFWQSIQKQFTEGLLTRAIMNRKYAVLERYLNQKANARGHFRVTSAVDSSIRSDVCEVEFSSHSTVIGLGIPEISGSQIIADRLQELSSLFVLCQEGGARGKLVFSLNDRDSHPSVAFCSSFSDSLLIPDFEFLRTRAHPGHLEIVERYAPDWSQRRPIAIWRGTTTGDIRDGDWRTLPRVRLCEVTSQRPDLFDVGISSITRNVPSKEVRNELLSRSFMREFVKPEQWVQYRYHIDIDGNSNAWSGLFKKLSSGSPVLKVTSANNFRQWYYDRLKPFVNFVPVQSDMSDLTEKLLWLRANDEKAQAIGQAGRVLILSLGYETELLKARDAIIARANRL